MATGPVTNSLFTEQDLKYIDHVMDAVILNKDADYYRLACADPVRPTDTGQPMPTTQIRDPGDRHPAIVIRSIPPERIGRRGTRRDHTIPRAR